MNLTVRIYPVGTGLLSQAEQVQIASWHHAEFSDLSVTKQYEWAVGGHFNVLLDVDGVFSGYVGLMKREVLFNDQKTLIAGVRGLVIDDKWRKHGLGKAIMAEAHKVIFRTLRADYGFLLCLHELEDFYTRLGWQPIRCPVRVENRSQKIDWTGLAMVRHPLGGFDHSSVKEIDLNGKAF